jgi:hypothetical protein
MGLMASRQPNWGRLVITTLSGAKAAALGIAALKKSGCAVKTVQEYH